MAQTIDEDRLGGVTLTWLVVFTISVSRGAMATKPSLRLAHAVLLFLLFLLTTMWLVGAAEGVSGRPTFVFWLVWLLPLFILPWLLSCCAPEETSDGHEVAARQLPHDSTIAERFASLVPPEIDVQRSYVEEGMPAVEGTLRGDSTHAFGALALPVAVEERLRRGSSRPVNLLLFLATLATTVFARATHRGVNLLQDPARFVVWLPYAVALLASLGVREMGHYVVARWHGVRVTLPYFIPVPMGLGTFGAFIQITSLIKSRRAVFDIGIAGPALDDVTPPDGRRFALGSLALVLLVLILLPVPAAVRLMNLDSPYQ